MFDERHTIGWSCNGPEAASQYQKCLDLASYNSPELGSGDLESNIVSKTRGNQCTCNVRESYYPVGVEHMKMWKADVTKAYRRIPVHPSDHWMMWVALPIGDEPMVARHNATPFGATGE